MISKIDGKSVSVTPNGFDFYKISLSSVYGKFIIVRKDSCNDSPTGAFVDDVGLYS